MSLTNLAALETASLFAKTLGLETKVYNFQRLNTDAAYADMSGVVTQVKDSMPAGGRILISAADGQVLMDTSKSNNSRANASAKAINENHNSRLSIISAGLSASGVATEKKYSSSTLKNEEYLAVRVGSSAQDAIGVIRYSI